MAPITLTVNNYYSFTTNVAVDPLVPVLRSTGVNKRMWYDHKARR